MTDEEKAEKKAAKEKARAERKAKGENVWTDFKKFIARGNVLDMSVGVIMGGAFNAIVTAFTNILLSICTWGVPGGLKGLVTVLPAINSAQAGMDPKNGLDQYFAAGDLQKLATAEVNATYGEKTVTDTPILIENMKKTILSMYTLHGTTYTYNMSAVIDWGTFINAVISFLIIALTLFIIVKVFNSVHASRLQFEKQLAEKAKAKEAEKAEAEKAEETK